MSPAGSPPAPTRLTPLPTLLPTPSARGGGPPADSTAASPPAAPLGESTPPPSGNGRHPDGAPAVVPLAIDAEEIRRRVGEEIVVFRHRTAGPSRFVLRECFE